MQYRVTMEIKKKMPHILPSETSISSLSNSYNEPVGHVGHSFVLIVLVVSISYGKYAWFTKLLHGIPDVQGHVLPPCWTY